jgi:hypothetical protein
MPKNADATHASPKLSVMAHRSSIWVPFLPSPTASTAVEMTAETATVVTTEPDRSTTGPQVRGFATGLRADMGARPIAASNNRPLGLDAMVAECSRVARTWHRAHIASVRL